MEAKKAAIELAFIKAGGVAALARSLNLQRRAVQHWKDNGHIPHRHIPAVSKATGVDRAALAPELYE